MVIFYSFIPHFLNFFFFNLYDDFYYNDIGGGGVLPNPNYYLNVSKFISFNFLNYVTIPQSPQKITKIVIIPLLSLLHDYLKIIIAA